MIKLTNKDAETVCNALSVAIARLRDLNSETDSWDDQELQACIRVHRDVVYQMYAGAPDDH